MKAEEEALEGRVIPYRIIMTRTNPLITTRIESIYQAIADAKIALIQN